MCMWLEEDSLLRNEASVAVSRSMCPPEVFIPEG